MTVLNVVRQGEKGEKGATGAPGEVSKAELETKASKAESVASAAAAQTNAEATTAKTLTRQFHLSSYGAKGDGVTNDLPAIEAALKAAEEAGGGSIIFFGKHLVTGLLEWKVNHTYLVGLPGAQLIGNYAAPRQAMIVNDWVNGNEDLQILNLTINRTGPNTQHGILLNGVKGFVMQGGGVSGEPPTTSSGALAISGIGPAEKKLSTNVRISGCLFQNTNNFGVQLGFVRNVSITTNTFDNCYREAVGVEPETGGSAENVTVTANTITTGAPGTGGGGSATGLLIITTNSGGAIAGVSMSANNISGTSIIAANTLGGILVNKGATGSLTGVVLEGNTIRNMNGQGIVGGTAAGITEGVRCVGNQIINCNLGENLTPNGAGIGLRAARRWMVEGNFVEGAKHVASVEETSSVQNNRIVGNYLRDATPIVLVAADGTVTYLNNVEKPTAVAETPAAIITALKALGLFN